MKIDFTNKTAIVTGGGVLVCASHSGFYMPGRMW